MSTLAGDFWVCGDCRSINNAGARQCYNCRTPRDRAAVDPQTIDPTSHGPLRTIELPAFKASRWAAALASVLILAVGVMQIVQFSLLRQYVEYVAAGTETEEQLVYLGTIGLVALGIALLALIAWALWLSRTVTSMPALGLGYPAANGMMAFVENFIPVLNLWLPRDRPGRRSPARAQDGRRRDDDPRGGAGLRRMDLRLRRVPRAAGPEPIHQRPRHAGDDHRHRSRSRRGRRDLPGRADLVGRGQGARAAQAPACRDGSARPRFRRAARRDGGGGNAGCDASGGR